MRIIDKLFPLIPSVYQQQDGLFKKARLLSFFLILVQVLAIFFVVREYQFEKSSGIIDYAPFIIIAFVIYNFIALRFRPAFIVLLSFSIIYTAFGLLAGSFIIACGSSLIAVCHLPIKFNYRLILILFLALLLAFLRTEFLFIPWMTMSVMYMAPMFMFRLIIYLYEIKHGLIPSSKWQSLVYFFMFPNIFFLFFPIVDYKTYIKTYFNAPENEIWQKGIRWMLRGLIHIMCYRLICFNLLIDATDVTDLTSLFHYMISNYSLILRLSGIFHFIIGLLCMFGFNLPQAFNNYFTATSFVDLWRRINIYWRDFVLKIFFYPTMFKYKKRIKKNLLAITMMTMFVITWLLHSYQLYWVTGSVSIKSIDAIFWLIVGACITVNSVIIERRTLEGKEVVKRENVFGFLIITLRMIGMLLFMSVMWSLWNSRTLEDWLFVVSKGKTASLHQLLLIGIWFIVVLIVGTLAQVLLKNETIKKLFSAKPQDTVLLTFFSLSILVMLSLNSVTSHLPAYLQSFIQNLHNSSPNIIEKTNSEIGYYDRLIEGDEERTIGIGGRSFKKLVTKNPYTNAYYMTDDIMHRRMKPNLKIQGIDHDFQSNSFGIRDKEYALKKPVGTVRLALLGGSYQMGSGVDNNKVFEAIAEERMNKELVDTNYKKFEIFNFAAGGYYLLQQVEMVNTSVFKYDFDGLIYFSHTGEQEKIVKDFTFLLKRKLPLKYPFLEYIQKVSGVKSYMSALQIREMLTPYADTIMKWGYKEIADKCKENGVVPVWTYMPTTTEEVNNEEYNAIKTYAESLGFVTLDLRDVYGKIDRKEIQISELNTHPNVLGHRLIAEHFYNVLKKNRYRIFKIKNE